MSLNTFWKLRAINALKSRSVIAVTAPSHWLISRWALKSKTHSETQVFEDEPAIPACKLPHYEDVSTNLKQWSPTFHATPAVRCIQCIIIWNDFLKYYGEDAYRKGSCK